MKHRRESGWREPAQVGLEVRARVSQFLESQALSLPIAAFFDRIERFAAALARWGGRTNLTAMPSHPAEIAFHILDSLAPILVAGQGRGPLTSDRLAAPREILDLGSGAGFPGLILAAATPAHFILAESRRRRSSFLEVAAAEMGLTNIVVDPNRRYPEEMTPAFDLVLGRAFAKPALFYRSAAAALRSEGVALLYAGASQSLDDAAAASAGLLAGERIRYEVPRATTMVPRLLVFWHKSA